MSELFNIIGFTDGVNTQGVCALNSDLIYTSEVVAPPTIIRIPTGMKAKIWGVRVSVKYETTFTLEYTNDVTAENPLFVPLDRYFYSYGVLSIEKKRPIIIRSFTGKEGFRITWYQAYPDLASIELDLEITDEE